MVEHLAMCGAAEEKAIAQLARSTGTFWLVASNSDQFATEFKQLGHGLFTYTILEALKGKADGGSKDKKITVKEISAYLNDVVPQLSQNLNDLAKSGKLDPIIGRDEEIRRILQILARRNKNNPMLIGTP